MAGSGCKFCLATVLIMSTIVLIMRTTYNNLGDLLFGKTRGSILRLLFGQSDRSFYTRQITKETRISAGAVQRELQTLTQSGLICLSRIGQQVFYQANRNHPLYLELHLLIAKTVGIYQLLSSALAPLAAHISVAFVYGSLARHDENAESDVDLMIVGNLTLDELLPLLAPVESTIGREINPTLYTAKELLSKLDNGNHFLQSVMKGEKVILIGDINELGKMGGVRMVESGANQPSGN